MKFDAAEKIKIAEGFVSLGGAYEEPDNPHQAAISKIARQFMTKLHIQVNQTLQFYRGQQGGAAPQRLFLSGGASIMPYTAQFFAEKLNVPVEYFNPFRNLQISPAVNLEDLSRVAHSFGEVVGLGLRNLATCPVEMNLMPDSTLRWQSLNQKKPYFIATVVSMVLVTFAVGLLFHKLAQNKEAEIARLDPQVSELSSKSDRFKAAYAKLQATQAQATQIATLLQQRYYWGDFLADMREAMIRSETDVRKKLSAQKPDVEVGIWIEQITTLDALLAANGTPEAAAPAAPQVDTTRYGRMARYRGVAALPEPAPTPDQTVVQTTNNLLTLVCRAVSLTSVDSSANPSIAYAVENEIKKSPMVDPKATQLSANISDADAKGTFTFTVNVTLLNPLKF